MLEVQEILRTKTDKADTLPLTVSSSLSLSICLSIYLSIYLTIYLSRLGLLTPTTTVKIAEADDVALLSAEGKYAMGRQTSSNNL